MLNGLEELETARAVIKQFLQPAGIITNKLPKAAGANNLLLISS
jgi:hypothetical protein